MKHELTTPDPNRVPLYHTDFTVAELDQAGWKTMPIAHVKVRCRNERVVELQFRIGIERGRIVWRVEDFNKQRIHSEIAKPAIEP